MHKIPDTLFIEMNNTCNIRCKMCSFNAMKRPPRMLDVSVVKRLIDEAVALNIPRVRLHYYGEPLINKDLIMMIKYCKEKGVRTVHLTSNATPLTDNLSKELILSGLDEIYFSVTGATQEVYQQFQGYDEKFSLAEIEQKIRALIKLKKSLQMATPKVTLQYICDQNNFADGIGFLKKWANEVEDISFSQLRDLHEERGRVKKSYFCKCSQVDTMLAVLSNGDLTICCGDMDGALAIGNVHDSSLEQLWHGERMQGLRSLFLLEDPDKLPKNCQTCQNVIDGIGNNSLSNIWHMQALRIMSRQIAAQKRQIVLFGANALSTNLLMEQEAYDKTVAVIDSKKTGHLRGKPIYPVSFLNDCDDIVVVILSEKYAEEMVSTIKEVTDKNFAMLRLDYYVQELKKQFL